jgi:hypothetical protein
MAFIPASNSSEDPELQLPLNAPLQRQYALPTPMYRRRVMNYLPRSSEVALQQISMRQIARVAMSMLNAGSSIDENPESLNATAVDPTPPHRREVMHCLPGSSDVE